MQKKSFFYRSLFPFVLSLFISFSAYSQSLKDVNFGSEYSLDVISWNLEWFPKNGQTTIDSLALVIKSLKPEVLALQEINDVSAFNSLLTQLPQYVGNFSSFSNLKLAFIYKKSLTINNIFTISGNSTYNFAGRPPYCIEIEYDNNIYYVINNHLKCCGDGILQTSDSSDEEFRRFSAMNIIKNYIEDNLDNKRVIVLGDLNDILTDNLSNNIFQDIINDSTNFYFADTDIAYGSSSNWSYPNWPSHLDHILISNELFSIFNSDSSYIESIQIDDYLSGGFSSYDNLLSDHMPIGISLYTGNFSAVIDENKSLKNKLVQRINLSGKNINHVFNQPIINIYDNGDSEKIMFVK